MSLKFVEDYIEYIAGQRRANGASLGIFDHVDSGISLARYDVSIIGNMASQTTWDNRAYTDRQAQLALRLIEKYRRQLTAKGVSVPADVSTIPMRMPIRIVNRERTVKVVNDAIEVRFPYDAKVLELINEHKRTGAGSCNFIHQVESDKHWRLVITEANVNFIKGISETFSFELDEAFNNLFSEIERVERTEYKIELLEVDGQLVITNCPESMREWIDRNLSTQQQQDALVMMDTAVILGVEISPALKNTYASDLANFSDVGYIGMQLCFNRIVEVNHSVDLDDVLAYARATNRLPVYIRAGGTTAVDKHDTNEVKYVSSNSNVPQRVPLLVSTTSLYIGTRRQMWPQVADKILVATEIRDTCKQH